ncbi:DUF5681 domain-containing protein [Nitrosococcus wardiae]|uniref:DUF5681 domain-containing protein n=1 Tax=Nitrosococcus wardiae TaxID=1814290 RepID=A0A4P7C1X4_9GAMM|nr:DUF5681 domain-containing protein [Nitrosococcus wardiae]QBQ53083.1 hypothetical protein E3U44_00095 [Nitrosococcus wardiae]QBQ56363.1 hypothetical protein E3U44_19055 [Nitrosococcus wardiae]QBQ56381.1 hypothetical protein E3U44_19145 [Nitrosococcus wardiae]
MSFKPGKSGNPAGRPKGTKDKRTEFRELLRPHAPDLIKKAVEMALEGDATALKLCLDKLIPNLRPQAEPVSIQFNGESLLEKGQEILKAVSKGEITPEEGNHLLASLANYGGLVGKEQSLKRHRDYQSFDAMFKGGI